MSSDIVLGIKLKWDGKDVTGGVNINRADFTRMAVAVRDAGREVAGASTHAASKLRSISEQLDFAKRSALSYFGATQLAGRARWILDQASAMQQLDARIRVATVSVQDHQRAVAGVFDISNRWGAAVIQTAGAFARLNPVVGQLGGDANITLRMIDGLAASLRLSGATAGETSAVLLQFSQAIGSGRVGGDEFRSMMESAEPLMRAVAEQLGKTTGELRQMAEDGKLTSSVFGNALLPAIDKLKGKAEQIPLGIGQAWQVLQNNLSRDFGREFGDQANVAARAIKSLSQNTGELAAGFHAAADAGVALVQVGAVAAAGAGGAWLTRQALAAKETAQAYLAARAARIAEAQAEEVQAAADVRRAQTTLALMTAERERAIATLVASNATIQATGAMGAHSAALAAGSAAAGRKSAALLMLTDASRIQSVAVRDLAAAEAALAAAQARTATATSVGTGAAALAGRAVAALGGPLGAAVTLLTAGATAWALWGSQADDASRKGESAADRVRRKLEDAQKQNRFGTGDIGQARQDLATLREEQARVQALFDGMPEAYRTAKFNADNAVREAATLVTVLERQQGAAAQSAGQRLSAAGEYSKLTADLKWREKLVREHQTTLLNLQTAFADKMAAATEKDHPALLRNHQAALAAELERQKQELEALPDAKEGKAVAEAAAEARIKAAQAASKRVLEVLKHENEQYRLSAEDMLRTTGAVKANAIEAEIGALQGKLAAATKESERLPIRERIQELRRDLAAIPQEVAAGLEEADNKRRDLLAKLGADAGRTLDPLARAGAEFGAKWGEAMQQAAANGWDDVLEAGRKAWESAAAISMFDKAKARFDGFAKEAEASLENIRVSTAAGTLPAVDALVGTEAVRRRAAADLEAIHAQLKAIAAGVDDPAVHAALAETTKKLQEAKLAAIDAATGWQAGANAAFKEYGRNVADSAGATKRAFGEGFRRAEDAVVSFVRNGKLSLREFADYAISEFYRITVAQPLISKLIGAMNGIDISSLLNGGNVGAGQSVANTAGTYSIPVDFGGAPIALPSAKGNAFDRAGRISYFAKGAAFSNSVVTTPTYFSYGTGQIGQMAEAGEEAVMPLKRGRGGRLGVEVMGGLGGSSGGTALYYSPTFHIDARGAAVGVGPMLDNIVNAALQRSRAEMIAELNAGGELAVATGRRR